MSINLQEVTKSVYQLLRPQVPMPLYNRLAAYNARAPYAIFDVDETGLHEYFSGTSDHTIFITITFYASRNQGAGALRRIADKVGGVFHKTHPVIAGMAGTDMRCLAEDNLVNAGNNLWGLTIRLKLVGSATA